MTALKTVQALGWRIERTQLEGELSIVPPLTRNADGHLIQPRGICVAEWSTTHDSRVLYSLALALIAQMQRDAVQPGWKLVPVEPTQQQAKAAADAWLDCGSRLVLNKALAAVRAGIAAAPQPAPEPQQDDHAGSPAPSEPVNIPLLWRQAGEEWGNAVGGPPQYEIFAAKLLASRPAPSAQSSKAALSDGDARLSEDELHARSWWCPTCKKDVPPEMVTKDGEHYLEAGGCGYAVRGELVEDQPKQPLSDDEIHRIWMETPARPTLAEEVLAFGHTLLARAGITRKPLSALDALKIVEGHIACRADDEAWQVCLRSASALRAILDGITPQAGKESGDAS